MQQVTLPSNVFVSTRDLRPPALEGDHEDQSHSADTVSPSQNAASECYQHNSLSAISCYHVDLAAHDDINQDLPPLPDVYEEFEDWEDERLEPEPAADKIAIVHPFDSLSRKSSTTTLASRTSKRAREDDELQDFDDDEFGPTSPGKS